MQYFEQLSCDICVCVCVRELIIYMLGNEFRIQINQCDHLQQYTLVMTVRQEGRGYEVHAELVGQSTGEGGFACT